MTRRPPGPQEIASLQPSGRPVDSGRPGQPTASAGPAPYQGAQSRPVRPGDAERHEPADPPQHGRSWTPARPTSDTASPPRTPHDQPGVADAAAPADPQRSSPRHPPSPSR